MKKPILTWAILRLIWESKGYIMKEMPDLLRSQWPGRKGFAFASLQRKTQTGKKAPSEVAEFVMDPKRLPIRAGYETPAEVVRLGLSALRGQPTPDRPMPELAMSLLAHFPTSALAHELADALMAQAGLSPRTGSLLDAFARSIARRLRPVLKPREAKLARHLGRYLDRLSTRHTAFAGAAGGVGGAVVVALGLIGLAFVFLSGRSPVTAEVARVTNAPGSDQAPHPPEVTANVSQQPVIIVANMTQGSAPFVFDTETLLAAVTAQMGQKPVDNPIPSKPLPNQKVPPCLTEAYEMNIDGGCWLEIGTAKPPCGRYAFRKGDKCYRPIAADPQKPVGLIPRSPGQLQKLGQGVTRETPKSKPSKDER